MSKTGLKDHIKIPKAKDKQIHRVCKGEKKGKAGKPDSNL
jgi:hypothetical protein